MGYPIKIKSEKIFLKDIKERIEYDENSILSWEKDRLIHALDSIINNIEKKNLRIFNIIASENIFEDEREQIEDYTNKRLSIWMDKKTRLLALRNIIRFQSDKKDNEKEIDKIIKSLNVDKD